MKVGIFPNAEALAEVGAQYIIDCLKTAEDPVLGLATGSTPRPIYQQLRNAHRDGVFSLRGVRACSLDEYVGIPDTHPESYCNELRGALVGEDRAGLLEENLNTPNAMAPDPNAEAARYENVVVDANVTLQILGIGVNGHIGFNEPGVSLASRTHVDTLTPQTRSDNARFFDGDLDAVPKLCITQGLGTIMHAERILLVATGGNKAMAIHQLVEGGVSARWPATFLQNHPDVVVLVDEDAATQLELKQFYRDRWEAAGPYAQV